VLHVYKSAVIYYHAMIPSASVGFHIPGMNDSATVQGEQHENDFNGSLFPKVAGHIII
jgi:hypothetical protein